MGRGRLKIAAVCAAAAAAATFPIWGMAPAVFLDSSRQVLARSTSPDSKHVAQVERLTVGGAANVVVMVRPPWAPDWYLAGCPVTSHYEDANPSIAWASNHSVIVSTHDAISLWDADMAPFHSRPCSKVDAIMHQTPIRADAKRRQ